jgi:alkylated DNA repair dioxygenase AlkB
MVAGTMDPKYKVSFVPTFLSAEESAALLKRVLTDRSHFKHAARTKTGAPSKKRNKTIYGEPSEYVFVYRGKTLRTPIRPWSAFPELEALAGRIAEVSGQAYKTCVIQIYNSGDVGIKPHRDKEMLSGEIIASVSLGATRVMRFERTGWETQDHLLEAGTLCLIHPPTNDYWLHSIPVDAAVREARVSLVFR